MSVRSFARAAANPVVALGVAILLVGGTAATAATGGTFLLGRSNSATATTGLTNTAGTALSLASKAGTPPLKVNNSTKVARLNADYVDGVDSTALQRRVTGTCADGAISSVTATGTVTCTALPARFNVSRPVGDSAVAVVGGATLRVSCTTVEEYEGLRYFMHGYFTGPAGTLVNGHAITTPYTMTTTTDPVGIDAANAESARKLPAFEAPDFAFSRQTAILMVTNGNAVTQVTLHLTLDTRGTAATPCSVIGTAV